MYLKNIRPLGLWYGLFIIFFTFSCDTKAAAMDEIAEAFSTQWRVANFNGRLSEWDKRELDEAKSLTKSGAKVQVVINIYTGAIKKGFTTGLNHDLIPRLVSRDGDKPCYPIFRIINNFDEVPDKSVGMTSLGVNIRELLNFITWLKLYVRPNLSPSPRFRCKIEHNFNPEIKYKDNGAINAYLLSLFTGIEASLMEEDGWDGDY
jgi:hypothetical protein